MKANPVISDTPLQSNTCRGINERISDLCEGEPVRPSGKALGWQAEGPQFRFASPVLSLQKLWSLDAVL